MTLYALGSMGKPQLMDTRRHTGWIKTLTALSALLGGLYLNACSSPQPKTQDDPEPPTTEPTGSASVPEPTDDTADDATDDSADDSADAPPPKRPKPVSDDYDVTYRDCQALAATYGRAWEKEELAKLEKKNFKPKLHERALTNVEKASRDAHDNWLQQCEGIVGSPYPYSHLKCALKAKTVKRFDDCWDGKAE